MNGKKLLLLIQRKYSQGNSKDLDLLANRLLNIQYGSDEEFSKNALIAFIRDATIESNNPVFLDLQTDVLILQYEFKGKMENAVSYVVEKAEKALKSLKS